MTFIVVIIFTCVIFLNKEKTNNDVVTEDVVTNQVSDEIQIKSGREWYPIPVINCEEIFKNQYHITFENGVTILTNKPAKIGDTTKCWINNWYQSKTNESFDSLIFENPY